MTERMEVLMEDWHKIEKWVEKNCKGVITKTYHFRWKFETYGWKEFYINPEGKCWIEMGSHGWPTDQWFNNPDHPVNEYFIKYKMGNILEEVVNDWQIIKENIYNCIGKDTKIYNFEP